MSSGARTPPGERSVTMDIMAAILTMAGKRRVKQ